jgi:hypothetical protein
MDIFCSFWSIPGGKQDRPKPRLEVSTRSNSMTGTCMQSARVIRKRQLAIMRGFYTCFLQYIDVSPIYFHRLVHCYCMKAAVPSPARR